MANISTDAADAGQGGEAASRPQRKPKFSETAGYVPIVNAASVLTLLLIWYVGSLILPSTVLSSPLEVTLTLWEQLQKPAIWGDMGVTLRRIALAFVLAMGVSMVLGFSMALSRFAGVFFRVWVVVGITVPALVIMLTVYMIAGLTETAAVLGAALPVIPVLTINIREGVAGIDLRLYEMATAFRASQRQIITGVVAPQIAPVLIASTRFGIGLIWKMVLFVELLGRSDGIGYKIEFYYQMFNMRQVLAHALSFLFVMLFIEVVILGSLERRAFRWRAR